MSAVDDDDDGRRHRRRRRRRRWLWRDDSTSGGVGVWISIVSAVVVLSAASAFDHMDYVNVVNVRVRPDPQAIKCSTKCSGLMITEYMVLTAASCSGTKVEPTTVTGPAERKKRMVRRWEVDPLSDARTEMSNLKTNSLSRKIDHKSIVPIPLDYITVQLRNVEIKELSAFRTVIGKYVHPDWNPETRVGDLALLKINERFKDFKRYPFPLIRSSWKLRQLNYSLSFRGYAKISKNKLTKEEEVQYLKGDHERIPDSLAKRILNVELSPDSCPLVENGSSLNPNWWSFLCSKPMYTHEHADNTLCNEDIGGPLYSLKNRRDFELYGVFSHAYHVKYPFCATHLCYTDNDEAPYPCNEGNDSGIYYRFTAMMGPTASWLRRVIELDMRTSTPPITRSCASLPPTEPGLTTLDPWYDVDMYEDRRSMVMNRKVCPSDHRHRASAGPPCRVDTATVAVTVVVFVVMVVLQPVPGDPP